MVAMPVLSHYIAAFGRSPLARWGDLAPWQLASQAGHVLRELLIGLPVLDYRIDAGIALHHSARVESGAVLKAPLIVGAGSFIAAGAYLRAGNWLAERCTVGPGVELKSCFIFSDTTLAHFNFVGDSVLGAGVNLEAGSIVCNHRNERADKDIRVRVGGRLEATGCEKFGALIGDAARIGANAVLAPGTLLDPGCVVPRAAHIDQETLP